MMSVSSSGRTTLRRIGLAIVGLPPLLIISAAVNHREKHRPNLPEGYKLQDLHGKTVVATGGKISNGGISIYGFRIFAFWMLT